MSEQSVNSETLSCSCTPCTSPQHGAPGHAHCAACCSGSLVEEYDHDCPIAEHRRMAELQWGPPSEAMS